MVKFEKGKWYKNTRTDEGWYNKWDGVTAIDGNFTGREYIKHEGKYCKDGSYFYWQLEDIVEVSIDEIAEFLPKNHPDLNILQFIEIY